MKLRAVTLLVDVNSYDGNLLPLVDHFSKAADRLAGEFGLSVWTKRLAVAPTDVGRLLSLAKEFDELPINYATIPVNVRRPADAKTVVDALTGTKRILTSLHGGEAELGIFTNALAGVANIDAGLCTRVSFTVDTLITTPYFPSAAAPPGGLGVASALLYVDDLRKALQASGDIKSKAVELAKKAYGYLYALSRELKVDNYGVDLSFSPWMEDSVAKLVEEYGKANFGDPGTHHTIFALNNLLREVASSTGVASVGYNEIMLPYAEDDRLKELGAQGKITAYSLLSLASVCVAGLDMVVLPCRDPKTLKTFMHDAYAVLSSKRRTSAIRVIPAAVDPGQTVDLGRFGSPAAMKIK